MRYWFVCFLLSALYGQAQIPEADLGLPKSWDAPVHVIDTVGYWGVFSEAERALQLRDYDQAERLYLHILSRTPTQTEALKALAYLCSLREDWARALQYQRRLIGIYSPFNIYHVPSMWFYLEILKGLERYEALRAFYVEQRLSRYFSHALYQDLHGLYEARQRKSRFEVQRVGEISRKAVRPLIYEDKILFQSTDSITGAWQTYAWQASTQALTLFAQYPISAFFVPCGIWLRMENTAWAPTRRLGSWTLKNTAFYMQEAREEAERVLFLSWGARPICAPVIDLEGKRLYFSAKHPEYEDLDLYVMERDKKGRWSVPKSLHTLNSRGDERMSSIDACGRLFFASTRAESFGGYDIFYSTYSAATARWARPIRLDWGVNSGSDDIDFVVDVANQKAFFSSYRKGEYHLYEVKAKDNFLACPMLRIATDLNCWKEE